MRNNIIKVLFLFGTIVIFGQNSTDFYRGENSNDSIFISENSEFINSQLTNDNGEDYYELAQALWRKKNNSSAEIMFRKIEKSNIELFNQTKLYNSDIPEDTTQNIYGYGSFTFNYKNRASIYLTKILIERSEFNEALYYLKLSDNNYIVKFNCGTGHNGYRRQISELYALCYEGLNQNEKAIELLLPRSLWYDNNNKTLSRVLRKVYTYEERKDMKESAIISIYYTTKKNELGRYAEGFIEVFNIKLNLGSVFLDKLKISPTEYFKNSYKNSYLYKEVYKIGYISFDD